MMKQRIVDITELAILGEQFPQRLKQLGFRLMQVIDEEGQDRYRYVVPPVCDVPDGWSFVGNSLPNSPPGLGALRLHIMKPGRPFQIGMYPVTVAEYACAVESGAVTEPPPAQNITWQMQQEHPDHPVVCISCFAAADYAAWLAKVTRQSWQLPTEAEWEKAARGEDKRIYPWGDEWDETRANTSDGGPQTTTPVGAYPTEASPYGASDMAGNVWEWTSNVVNHHAPSRRMRRGGLWRSSPQLAYVFARNEIDADSFDSSSGMRLAFYDWDRSVAQ